ncbi:cwl1 [Blastomyces gilchristii SLH14081]|uniref:Reticulon-like protein n=2 Tax=Blastomyces TaxID=229219 RepID=A0A179UZY8_BLAGS|nr:cwl1 [Blastomyces gilchristii SLH14081]OAT13646.1 cwl1 [Blastomyces gilchristii SLH14081]
MAKESTQPGGSPHLVNARFPPFNSTSMTEQRPHKFSIGAQIDALQCEEMYSDKDVFHHIGSTRVKTNGTTDATATGQPLTHYHSRIYSLLSWERPRTTAVSFATIVSLIIAARYLPLLRWLFKFSYLSLGFTISLEVAGKVMFSRGLASSSRPRKYYTIPKDTVESILEDLEQLMDFFLIEFQRILFAENLTYTLAAFTAALTSYWLVRFLPLWGLALILVSVAYLGPLVYINNREIIDTQIDQIQQIVNSQATQVKEMAGQQTAHATHIVKQYVGDYTAKANEYMGSARSLPHVEQVAPTTVQAQPELRSAAEPAVEPLTEPAAVASDAEPVASELAATEPTDAVPAIVHTDFPTAPKDDIVLGEVPARESREETKSDEPLLA